MASLWEGRSVLRFLSQEATSLMMVGGGVSGVFFAGGYYFSMKEKYERQVEALMLQLTHEKQVREMQNEMVMLKLNQMRDQQALTTMQVRRETDVSIISSKMELQRWLFDMAFDGDYEEYRADLEKAMALAEEAGCENATEAVDAAAGKVPAFFSEILKQVLNEELLRLRTKAAPPPTEASGTAEQAREAARSVTVTVKNSLDEVMCTCTTPQQTAVKDLKYMIEDYTLVAPEQQKLYFNGQRMMDGPTLDDYEVQDQSTIHLHFKLRPQDVRRNKKRQSRVLSEATRIRVASYADDCLACFDSADCNGDEILSLEDAKSALYKTIPAITPGDFDALFFMMDDNGSGYVSRKEWVRFFSTLRRTAPAPAGAAGTHVSVAPALQTTDPATTVVAPVPVAASPVATTLPNIE
eukprot:NODE_7491_length_1573_cov_17.003458.p1 GENE.NODE_7491_length_1573_cov_17.003458~~NODE_7491_length_1573_cov_17.003458.p1  ORF type:complete len:410 (+),score=96.48 NODE_7491_length_1573_cov_17.003458:137-1366(+)